jgi:hypothetical protein
LGRLLKTLPKLTPRQLAVASILSATAFNLLGFIMSLPINLALRSHRSGALAGMGCAAIATYAAAMVAAARQAIISSQPQEQIDDSALATSISSISPLQLPSPWANWTATE